jgi:outer membrane immunogenic protein
MKTVLLLSAAILGGGIGTCLAADLAAPPTSDWTGFHGSFLGGYSQISVDGTQENSFGTWSDDGQTGGTTIGIGVGYQHSFGDFVLGVDGDVSFLMNETQLAMKDTVDADYDWFATARASAGWDLNGTLIYGTGGLAVLSAEFDDGSDSKDQTFYGWTAGAGVEHMINESISLKVEGLYADFGSEDFKLSGNDTKIDNDMWLVRGGISLHF